MSSGRLRGSADQALPLISITTCATSAPQEISQRQPGASAPAPNVLPRLGPSVTRRPSSGDSYRSPSVPQLAAADLECAAVLLQLSVFYIAGPLLGARLPPQFSPRAAGTQSPASSTMTSQSGATSMHAAPSARPDPIRRQPARTAGPGAAAVNALGRAGTRGCVRGRAGEVA